MTLKKKKTERKLGGFQESSVGIKEIKALFYPEYDKERKRVNPLCCLSLRAVQPQESGRGNSAPSYTLKEKHTAGPTRGFTIHTHE